MAMQLLDHPMPVKGAAEYYAYGNEVIMRCTTGEKSVIETKASNASALKSARSWQKRENKAVDKERKRLEKLAKSS